MNAVFGFFGNLFCAHPKTRRPALAVLGTALLLTACSPEFTFTGLREQLGDAEIIIRIFMGLFGLLLMLAGFALYEFIIALIGFMIGGASGAILGLDYATAEEVSVLIPLLVGFLLGGLIGAALASFLTCLAVFLAGVYAGGAFFAVLWMAVVQEEPHPLALLAGAVLGGIIMLILYRFWITALTSAMGSVLFCLAIDAPPWTWILFFIFGILVQYGLGKASGNEEKVQPRLRPANKAAPVVLAGAAGAAAAGGAYQRSTARPSAEASRPAPQQPVHSPRPTTYQPPSARPASQETSQDAAKFCPACGQKIRAKAAFCSYCGSPQ